MGLFLAVLVTAIVIQGVGALWYMGFAKPWMAAVGMTEEEVKANENATPYILSGIASLLIAIGLYWVMTATGRSGIGAGVTTGFLLGLLFAAPPIIMHYAFSARPRALWAIDAGHTIAATTLGGAVMGLML